MKVMFSPYFQLKVLKKQQPATLRLIQTFNRGTG
jgi:hypothetical protein